jgi:hypothetical protein
MAVLAAPIALFAQDKPKPTEKPDEPKVKQYEEDFLRAALKAIGEKPKADETKPAKPTEPKPADPKPKQFELEFKIVPNPTAKAKPDEPKPEKPADPKSKVAQYREEVQKAAEAEIKEARERLLKQKQELLKATEALVEETRKAKAQQRADEPKPADGKTKDEVAKTKAEAERLLRAMKMEEDVARAKEQAEIRIRETIMERRRAEDALSKLAQEVEKAKPQQKPGDPQPKPKAVEVQLQYKTEKDGDADQKLQKLEAQLQALLQEIQAMRAAKPGWEKKPVAQQLTPEQKKVLRVFPQDDTPRVLVVPAQPAPAPVARPQTLAVPGTPAPVSPPAEAIERRTVRARFIERDGGEVINLTRATYTLAPASAKALDDFLKTQVKAKVLETRVEGDRITVTTTPDIQHIIAQFIALMQGKTPVTALPGARALDGGTIEVHGYIPAEGEPLRVEVRSEPKAGTLKVSPHTKVSEETLRLWIEEPAAEKTVPTPKK